MMSGSGRIRMEGIFQQLAVLMEKEPLPSYQARWTSRKASRKTRRFV